MNYDQLMALFRVEERSVAVLDREPRERPAHDRMTILLVVVLDQGPIGVSSATSAGRSRLLGAARLPPLQLGLEFDRPLFLRMNSFGLPFVPSAVAISAIDFGDRFFIVKFWDRRARASRDRRPHLGRARVRDLAFRMAWPAFAYSIRDDDEAADLRLRAHLCHPRHVLGGAGLGLGVALDRALLETPAFFRRPRPWWRRSASPGSRSARTSWS